jgi:hypothetical protein
VIIESAAYGALLPTYQVFHVARVEYGDAVVSIDTA